MAERKETNAEFAAILDKLKRGKPVVLAASTHDGEEVLIAEAVRKAGGFPLIVPRHANAAIRWCVSWRPAAGSACCGRMASFRKP